VSVLAAVLLLNTAAMVLPFFGICRYYHCSSNFKGVFIYMKEPWLEREVLEVVHPHAQLVVKEMAVEGVKGLFTIL